MATGHPPADKDDQGAHAQPALVDGHASQTLSMSQLPQLVDMLAAIRIDLTSHAKGSASDGDRLPRVLAELDAAIAVAKRLVVDSSADGGGLQVPSENTRGRGAHL